MKLSNKHIVIVAAFLAVALIGYWAYNKFFSGKKKGVEDIQAKTEKITNYSPANNPSTPAMYGAQNVVFSNGFWSLAPGTCELVTTGIVDWAAIKAMTDASKEQLYKDIDNCRAESLPLLQPA